MHRPSPAHLVLVGVLLAGVGLDAAAPATLAGAPSHKTFQTTVGDGVNSSTTSLPIAGGALPPLQFTLANTGSGPQAVPYGSFQLQIPTGITVTGGSYPT